MQIGDSTWKLVVVSHRRNEIICEQERTISKLKAQLEKMRWHIVADDDLPKDRHNVYIVYLNGEYMQMQTIASYRHKYWVIDGHKTDCEVIAWCELPKWEGRRSK